MPRWRRVQRRQVLRHARHPHHPVAPQADCGLDADARVDQIRIAEAVHLLLVHIEVDDERFVSRWRRERGQAEVGEIGLARVGGVGAVDDQLAGNDADSCADGKVVDLGRCRDVEPVAADGNTVADEPSGELLELVPAQVFEQVPVGVEDGHRLLQTDGHIALGSRILGARLRITRIIAHAADSVSSLTAPRKADAAIVKSCAHASASSSPGVPAMKPLDHASCLIGLFFIDRDLGGWTGHVADALTETNRTGGSAG